MSLQCSMSGPPSTSQMDRAHFLPSRLKDTDRLRRVLMTTDTVGGVWTFSLELAQELMKNGIQVALATMGAPLSAEQRRQAAFFPSGQIHESRFRLEWMEEPWPDLEKAGEWLLYLEGLVNPDVVHLNNFAHGNLPWRSPVLLVGHSCVLSWWRAVRGCDAPPSWHRYHQAVQTGLRSADKIVAPSQWMLAALQSFYGPFDTGTVVYNGRRASRFSRGVKDPFLFTAGRLWDEGKNVAALTRIASFLPWPVFLAGESANPGGSDGSDSHSPKRAQVYRLGHISEQKLASWLSRAALYVLPAKYEPFGLSAVEAGLAGCALVLSDIPSLREIWEDAAVFVPPDDDQALQSVLERLIRDEPTRQTFAARAQQRARHFSATHMASGYLALYDTLLQSKTSQGKELRKDRPCVL